MKIKRIYAYVNIIRFKNDQRWYPIFETKYFGSDKHRVAVGHRKEAYNYFNKLSGGMWKKGDLKTVKILISTHVLK